MKNALTNLLKDIKHEITLYSLVSSFLFYELADVNWLGFYLVEEDGLYLGPFQGLPACIYIPKGKGACGRCAQTKEIILLPNVKKDPNYIACHAETQSEVVFPIIVNDEVIAVLDIDSLSLNRFTTSDIENITACVKIIENHLQQIKR